MVTETKMHLHPFDITTAFSFHSWGFSLTFRGKKGLNGDGADATVTLHFSASWLDTLAYHLKDLLGKLEQQVAETRNTFKL